MLAGWFARDRRPAIRERKFLNGTYVRNIRSRTCRWVPRLLTCPGIRMHSAFLIDAARRKKVSSLMERVVDKRKGGGNNTFTNCWRSWRKYPSQGFSCFVLAATAVQEAEGREVGTMDTLSLESFRFNYGWAETDKLVFLFKKYTERQNMHTRGSRKFIIGRIIRLERKEKKEKGIILVNTRG